MHKCRGRRRPTGQGLFPTILLHSHHPWRSDVGSYDSREGGGRPRREQRSRAMHDSMDGGVRTASGTAVEEQLPGCGGAAD